jgi:hypothetical protein
MVNHFLDHKCGRKKTDNLRLRDQLAKGRHLIIDVKIVHARQSVQASLYLLFKGILIGCLNQALLNQFGSDRIGKGFRAIPDPADCQAAHVLFGGFYFG